MKFTIDRATWRCGGSLCTPGTKDNTHGQGTTVLLNEEGYMCCLGQNALQLGEPREHLLNKPTPVDVLLTAASQLFPLLVNRLPDDDNGEMRVASSFLTGDAMHANDSCNLSRSERETALAAVYAKHGHECEFIGEYQAVAA